RRLFAPAFTPKALAALEPRVVRFVDGLLDRAAARGGMDVVDDFAAALPVQLIGDMLGVPQAERAPLRAWSLAILGALEPEPGPARHPARRGRRGDRLRRDARGDARHARNRGGQPRPRAVP